MNIRGSSGILIICMIMVFMFSYTKGDNYWKNIYGTDAYVHKLTAPGHIVHDSI